MESLQTMRPIVSFVKENITEYSFVDCMHWSILRCCWVDFAMHVGIPHTYNKFKAALISCTTKYALLFMLTEMQTTAFDCFRAITSGDKYVHSKLTGSETIPTPDLFKVISSIFVLKKIYFNSCYYKRKMLVQTSH